MPVTLTGRRATFRAQIYNDVQGNQYNKKTFVNRYNVLWELFRASSANAAYDADARQPVSLRWPETRMAIVDELVKWATSSDTHPARLFWVYGVAACGKSTLSQHLAETIHEKGYLGASYFFSYSDSDRNSTRLLFTTIAYQLCLVVPGMKEKMRSIFHKGHSVVNKSFQEQLRTLIIEPMTKLQAYKPGKKWVVIIDALNECVSPEAPREIITVLAETLRDYPSLPLRFLVTSLPLEELVNNFQNCELLTRCDLYGQHDARACISKYLTQNLEALSRDRKITGKWYSNEDVKELCKQSESLFLYATTVIRFVADRYHEPCKRFKLLFAPVNPIIQRLKVLDRLYMRILNQIDQDIYNERIKKVLSIIIFAEHPLSQQAICDLTDFDAHSTRNILKSLVAFVVFPLKEGDSSPVRLVHTTFLHFIKDQGRSSDFVIIPDIAHGELARQCFRLMGKLSENICEIEHPDEPNSKSVSDAVCQKRISEAMAYACRSWCIHVKEAVASPGLTEEMALFLNFSGERWKHWAEVMSIIGSADERMLVGLLDLEKRLRGSNAGSDNLPNNIQQIHIALKSSLDRLKSRALYIYWWDAENIIFSKSLSSYWTRGNKHWSYQKCPKSGRYFAVLEGICWLEVFGTLKEVPAGRYNVVWRLKLCSIAKNVDTCEFRTVTLGKDQSTVSSRQTFDRATLKNAGKEWFDFVIPINVGEQSPLAGRCLFDVRLEISDTRTRWKSGLCIDYVKLVCKGDL